MPTWCFTCELTNDQRDIAIASWYALGMLGSEEKPAGPESVQLKVYFKDREVLQSAIDELNKMTPVSPASISVVDDQDWNATWRASMKPARLARGILVSPTWLKPKMREGDRWIKIEPKMAFGTGHHETTRLAAQALIRIRKQLTSATILDIGTGSGVLCFTADMHGSGRCIGIEIDPVCAENLAENLQNNPPSGRIDFLIGTLDTVRPNVSIDVAVMNMILTESAPQLPYLQKMCSEKAWLVWSGILTDEYEKAVDAAREYGFNLKYERIEHEWWCGTFRKESKA